MASLAEILERNRRWAERIREDDPTFLPALAAEQRPEYLWIGCADSRVSANEIAGLRLGEVFVHRNVANVVVHTDLNCLSVLQYAVDVLGVTQVVVCGHFGCGGVKAALEDTRHGLIDNWLRHVRDVAEDHADELAALPPGRAHDRLCELNVARQVENVCETTIVEDAWAGGRRLEVHGVVYGLDDGLLRDLGVSRRGVR